MKSTIKEKVVVIYLFKFTKVQLKDTNKKPKYVLSAPDEKYVVEYLLRQLILSESIIEALTFDDQELAIGF